MTDFYPGTQIIEETLTKIAAQQYKTAVANGLVFAARVMAFRQGEPVNGSYLYQSPDLTIIATPDNELVIEDCGVRVLCTEDQFCMEGPWMDLIHEQQEQAA